MDFLFDGTLQKAIADVAREDDAMCAVAFWGQGSPDLLSSNAQARVICNLKTGGTNPFAIEKLDREKTRQMDDLHAKVYIGKAEAVVGSANASANGLGLEGSEQSKWREAGMHTRDVEPLKDWFEKLWSGDARKITKDDLEAAKKAWLKRQEAKPTLSGFEVFNVDDRPLPALCWITHTDTQWFNQKIEEQSGGRIDKSFQERLNYGFSVDNEVDREHLAIGRWVLVYYRRDQDGLPAKRPRPYWTYIKGYLVQAASINGGEPTDWVLRAQDMPNPPFEITRRFMEVFSATLSGSKYEPLRRVTYDSPYFKPLEPLMHDLWRDAHSLYLSG